jgi:parvulin-like peptidyl-prolyl isomerase
MNAAKDLSGDTTGKPRKGWRDFTRVNTRRSIALFAVGAVVGLILAGFALFTAKGTSTLVVPPEDVALVNQQPIARSDFYLQLKALYNVDYAQTTREQRQAVLDQMIREELFVQRGKELDMASVDPDVRTAMVSAVEQGIAADVVASKPSDEKLMAYYKAHQETYSTLGRMTLRDLVFPTAEAAASASQALNAGAEPGAVAAQYHGKDSGRVNGEEFYFAAKIHLGDAMFAAARPLLAKQASKPIPAADGTHVLYMVNNLQPKPNSFAEARSQVLADYEKEAIDRLQKGDANFFRKRANVLIAPDMR